jgi:protein-disulfide isomerase
MRWKGVVFSVFLGLVGAVLIGGGTFLGLRVTAELDRLRGEVRSLRLAQDSMQERLASLAQRAGSSVRQGQSQAGQPVGVDGAAVLGSEDAPVTIVEFSDFQCPYCLRHSRTAMPRLIEAYVKTGKVRYVLRDLPLESIHPAAFEAAMAARCAGDQGRYWELHDRFFAQQPSLKEKAWEAHAEAVGLDIGAFRACLEDGKYADAVRRDIEAARRLGVRGTPTFFIGRTQPGSDTMTAAGAIRGAQPYRVFERAIESLLASEAS